MKIVRYQDRQGNERFGCVQKPGEITELEGSPFGPHLPTNKPAEVARLLAPVSPVAILCIGLNYRAHAEETGQPIPKFPVLFMKQPAALQDPDQPIVLPESLASGQVDYEGELVVVIGRRCKNVKAADAHHYILGYTCGNDVSARDWQKQWGGGQFCRGKTFDTFAPIGPWVVTTDEIPDPAGLTVTTRVNGAEMQHSSVGDLIFSVPRLIEFLSGSTTLMPGTLIFTGTPSGVGAARTPPLFLKEGDRVEVEISGIGTLSNPVLRETSYAGGR